MVYWYDKQPWCGIGISLNDDLSTMEEDDMETPRFPRIETYLSYNKYQQHSHKTKQLFSIQEWIKDIRCHRNPEVRFFNIQEWQMIELLFLYTILRSRSFI